MYVLFERVDESPESYERVIRSEITGKLKRDYIGQYGCVLNPFWALRSGVYDVKFKDGQVWALEEDQFTVVDQSEMEL